MRSSILMSAAISSALAVSLAAQSAPAGWSLRTDRDAPSTGLTFQSMGSGFHVTSGPAAIFYNEANAATGKFHTLATFTQTKAPAHPEGYGLFFAGSDLKGEGQKYIYFLVRGDGNYLIKKREGSATPTVVPWTPSDAIHKADASGKATNKLEIDGKSSGDQIKFSINGTVVYTMDPSAAPTNGIIGFRVNHGLDVHIDGFAVHKM